jgi:enoyl-CoA hydratase/carnithine racemase
MPGFGGTQRLARTIGVRQARELLLAGDLVSPRRAAEIGLVSRVLGRDRFLPDVLAVADRLARRPPLAIAALKRALYGAADGTLHDGLYVELAEVAKLTRSRDTRSGMRDYTAELRRQLELPVESQLSLGALVAKLDGGELTTFVGS